MIFKNQYTISIYLLKIKKSFFFNQQTYSQVLSQIVKKNLGNCTFYTYVNDVAIVSTTCKLNIIHCAFKRSCSLNLLTTRQTSEHGRIYFSG